MTDALRFRHVVYRNYRVWRKLLYASLVGNLVDPLFWLVGLGFGLGSLLPTVGGMPYLQREEEVEKFRKPIDQGGARFLICTDAAGEGINLQFCWIMINYDVPWNPARLEQRMGRIHRYGQKHDPVVIMNLVAPKTREGKVLKVLLAVQYRSLARTNAWKAFWVFQPVVLARVQNALLYTPDV